MSVCPQGAPYELLSITHFTYRATTPSPWCQVYSYDLTNHSEARIRGIFWMSGKELQWFPFWNSGENWYTVKCVNLFDIEMSEISESN